MPSAGEETEDEQGGQDELDVDAQALVDQGSFTVEKAKLLVERILGPQAELVHAGPRERFVICPENGISEEDLAKQAGPEKSRELLKMGYDLAVEGISRILKLVGHKTEFEQAMGRYTAENSLPQCERTRRQRIRGDISPLILRGTELLDILSPDRSTRRSSKLRSTFIDGFVQSCLTLEHVEAGQIEYYFQQGITQSHDESPKELSDELKKVFGTCINEGFIPYHLAKKNWECNQDRSSNLRPGLIAYMMADDDKRRISVIALSRQNNKVIPAKAPTALPDDVVICAIKVRGPKSDK